ncbi:MAG: RDD family protein, partial [Verrucomicrobiota bacterium]
MSERDDQSGPSEQAPPPMPGPKSLLDSIFRDGGPMPPARISLRLGAALLDIVLLLIVTGFIAWKIAVPMSYPGALAEFLEISQSISPKEAIEEWVLTDAPPEELSENLQQAITYAFELQLTLFWIYFAVGEAFFGGSSLGKRLLRIRTVSTVTLDKPTILIGIVRGGTKTLILFLPIAALANLIVLFFNKRKQ